MFNLRFRTMFSVYAYAISLIHQGTSSFVNHLKFKKGYI